LKYHWAQVVNRQRSARMGEASPLVAKQSALAKPCLLVRFARVEEEALVAMAMGGGMERDQVQVQERLRRMRKQYTS
jgi:hypothetical protein